MDRDGRTLDFMLFARRNMAAAQRFSGERSPRTACRIGSPSTRAVPIWQLSTWHA
ncbi:hypothetical protein FGG78_23800 [Thioclava sp. BHET1]|nr:hypothetical protein FGG78_23800 [Thioclava sp. BHET1]